MSEPHISLKVALLGPSISDRFDRTVTSGWGGGWITSGGSSGDYSVMPGYARHSLGSANVSRRSHLGAVSLADVRRSVLIRVPALATGASIQAGVMLRHLDSSNYYVAEIQVAAAGSIDLRLRRNAGGSLTTLATVPTHLTHTPTTWWSLAAEMTGSTLRARVWAADDVEPTSWQAEVVDTALPGPGAPGLRSIAGVGAGGLPLLVEWADDTTTPAWTDLAGRIHYGDGGGPLTIDIGRQTEAQDVEPTRIACTLRNADGWLTPRNPLSPYYGTWEQGREIRVTETVAGEEIPLAVGYLEVPDVAVSAPGIAQPCSITAVDRLGRLAAAPPMEGTLAEHVRTYGGGRLVEWYPLSDQPSDGRYLSPVTGTATERVAAGWSGGQVLADPADLLQPAAIDGPPGDDQRYASWHPVGDADGVGSYADAMLVAPLPLTVAAGDTIAVSVWCRLGAYEMAAGSEEPAGFLVSLSGPGQHLRIIRRLIPVSGAPDQLYAGSSIDPGPGGATFMDVGRPYEADSWRLVTVRVVLSAGRWEMWVGADAAVTQTIPPPGPQTYTTMEIGSGWSGALGHVQVRVGPDATTMTREQHLAQYAHGYQGLDRQTVAERIATIAAYAGVPASELDLPQEASTPLLPARLGGQTPTAAMQTAATAGQDLLVTSPDGRITLVPRVRRYNQPVTMRIPFGWIERGGVRYRPDRPLTDAVASRPDGGTARAVDQRLRARYGISSRSVTLETAIDADLANWASWTVRAHGEPRTRCPILRLDLLRRAPADRAALTKLRVGDRIELTGMPPGSPEDVPHLIVQGIRHIIGPGRARRLELNAGPLLGPAPGVAPSCPVVGDLVSDTAIIAY